MPRGVEDGVALGGGLEESFAYFNRLTLFPLLLIDVNDIRQVPALSLRVLCVLLVLLEFMRWDRVGRY